MKQFDLESKDIARSHNINDYNTTEYSFVTSYIWSDLNKVDLYERDGNKVIVINNNDGSLTLIPLDYYSNYSSSIKVAVDNIGINNISEIKYVCEETKDVFNEYLKDIFDIEEDRDSFDYIYEADVMKSLTGKKNSKKRNHLNYFFKEYEGRYEYKTLGVNDFDDCLKLVDEWQFKKGITTDMINEYTAIKKIFDNYSFLFEYIKIGGVYIDGALKAFSVGSLVNKDMAVIHIEKADSDIRGLYPFITQQFLINEFGDVKYVNREDDMGLDNIRKSKMSYHPCCFAKKYKFVRKKSINK